MGVGVGGGVCVSFYYIKTCATSNKSIHNFVSVDTKCFFVLNAHSESLQVMKPSKRPKPKDADIWHMLMVAEKNMLENLGPATPRDCYPEALRKFKAACDAANPVLHAAIVAWASLLVVLHDPVFGSETERRNTNLPGLLALACEGCQKRQVLPWYMAPVFSASVDLPLLRCSLVSWWQMVQDLGHHYNRPDVMM